MNMMHGTYMRTLETEGDFVTRAKWKETQRKKKKRKKEHDKNKNIRSYVYIGVVYTNTRADKAGY